MNDNRSFEIIHAGEKKNNKKCEENLFELKTYALLEFQWRREKGSERLFEEMMPENSPNLKSYTSKIIKLIDHSKIQPKSIFSKTHYNKTVWNHIKKEF